MKRRLLAALILLGLGPVPARADFTFGDFSTRTNLNVRDSAAVTPDNVLRLTPALLTRTGTVIFADKQAMRSGFETRFRFQITATGGILDASGERGGDGFALIIQNVSATETGLFGPAPYWHMPYSIPDALAVEFDTWRNELGCESCFDINDPNGNHISLQAVGAAPDQLTELSHDGSLAFTTTIPNLSDGNVHEARIHYVPGSMRVFVDGMLVLTAAIDLTNVNGVNRLDADGKAWIGLGAATGGAFENHDILSWSFASHVPPTANAGPDQPIHAGQRATLDGRASFDDNTATEQLTFAWAMMSVPEGSSAALSGASTATPSFVADFPGEYVARLVVTDADGLSSTPDTVTVSSLNAAPVADAGGDQGSFVGSAVMLDGSASRDPDQDPLRFSWALAAPATSAATLAGETTAFPTFVPDVPGNYTATLTVSDAFGGLSTDMVDVSVITGRQFAESRTMDALNVVGALSPTQVTTRGNQRALQRLLIETIEALREGAWDEARDRLRQAIVRTDGCALRGSVDGSGSGRDWVTDCSAQTVIYRALTEARDGMQ